METLDVPRLLEQVRDGHEPPPGALAALVAGYTAAEIPDYQLSAFTMAVCLRGLSARATEELTLAMRDSGDVLPRGGYGGVAVDKHSTGGVGDKVSLALAPLVASVGLRVPMIAGRGLGHTGGTIDKLESIPGYRTKLTARQFARVVKDVGVCIAGQSPSLAPADRALYALRDVTGTVPSIPLITASILSKKLAAGLDGLVLDVKVGRGAFMPSLGDAHLLGRSLVDVGTRAGVKMVALLTDMDTPLGTTVGNALEVREAIGVLHGDGSEALVECILALGVEMLLLGGLASRRAAAETTLRAALHDGRARTTFARMLRAQGADAGVVDDPDAHLPLAPSRRTLRAGAEGYVVDIDPRALADVALRLGAGRQTVDDVVDPRVGVALHVTRGDAVGPTSPLVTVHAADAADARRVEASLRGAFTFGPRRPSPSPLILERLRPRGTPRRAS